MLLAGASGVKVETSTSVLSLNERLGVWEIEEM